MQDKLLEMIRRDFRYGAYGNSLGEKEASRIGAGKFIDGMYIAVKEMSAGTISALESLFGNIWKSRRTPSQVNYGNCPEGYNLEKIGEDDEYVMTLCSGGNHALLLAKKTHKHEASNGGFGKDNTLSQAIDGNKYD